MKPTQISPSSLFLYMQSKDKYYCQYLSDNRLPRMPESEAMSVGSAFDAYVKCAIQSDLGVKGFDLQELLEKQVAPANLGMAREAGWYILCEYKKSGAYALLLEDLEASDIEPMFEFYIESQIDGVPVKGFPDCFYRRGEFHIVVDFKVNGYMTLGKPKPHFIRHHATGNKHKKAVLAGPIPHNVFGLECTDKNWAIQQAMYALALGAKDYLCTLEQIVGAQVGLDFYTYRAGIGKPFEDQLRKTLKQMWYEIQNDCVVSAERAAELDGPFRHLALSTK